MYAEDAALRFCRHLPKLELHAHLNGSIRPETLRSLAEAKGMSHLLAPLNAVAAKGNCCSLEECFMLFGIIHQLTTDFGTISAIASQVVLDFAEDNVVYLELRTSPKSREGMTKELYVKAVLDGIDHALGQLQLQQQKGSNGTVSSTSNGTSGFNGTSR
ncbi:hypothetical protein DUNSADRAFT_14944 [Dunaliella salina]|uniref:Adenosine deaminase domain-containing protein n=1 Tax=Dunaliella salina TaxID=3046 RepID=A0ABQ7G6D8_DUNSA|nr:hypothetical protein DUNSADRAFT_14944 [Dunaliella salina]|eukprot:KAF5830167.1 hypothetical protein DUNSADRAFT_14944 [Dunaliella salina]